MTHQAWHAGAAGYLGMWMAMMVPMMLPSLVPVLARYRRSVRGAGAVHPGGATVLVGVGYFAVWAALGVAVYAAGACVTAVEMRWELVARGPVVAGVVLLAAGGVQLTSWKARRLARCREWPACCPPVPNALDALRQGLGLGVWCSLSCGSLMLALLAIGMMDLVAMAAVTLAISAERLAPASLRIARVAGVGIVMVGVLTIARVQ
jgi:predicted metal-binding membrane protein